MDKFRACKRKNVSDDENNEIHNNLQMPHSIAIFVVINKLSEEKLQEEAFCI